MSASLPRAQPEMDLEAAIQSLVSDDLGVRKKGCIALTRHADAGQNLARAVPGLARILERDALSVWVEATTALWAIARSGQSIASTTVQLLHFRKQNVGKELALDQELRETATSALVHEYTRRGSSHAFIADRLASSYGGARAIREMAERTGRMRGKHFEAMLQLVAHGTDDEVVNEAVGALAAHLRASPRHRRAFESAVSALDASTQALVRARFIDE
jgi:hypothetical protein